MLTSCCVGKPPTLLALIDAVVVHRKTVFVKTVMPYPILTLPYPFAKRLRQLLDPFELEQLQQAAGHDVVSGLKPIVSPCKANDLYFKKNFTTDPGPNPTCELYLGSNPIILPQNKISIPKNDQYLIKCNVLYLYNMPHLLPKTLTTENLSIKVFKMDLQNCHISNDLFEQLSKIVVKPIELCMWVSPNVDEDVTFSTILNIFPSINSIALAKSYFRWLSDLASTRRQFLKVDVFHHVFDKIFSFRPEELYKFCVHQPSQFRLHLIVETDDIEATFDKIKPFIDPRFDTEEYGFLKIIITVKRSAIRFHRQYYYFKKI